ncbi:GMC family oxidoreductase [Saccharothrix sp. ST-888]|uniref:GMC family oxidoreductase n=1 Tax=Saccharothrix sp. ST-888 TaxID=1427391 RepID=UPI0005ED0785|nr:GMC family oxidoreductase [Saccharothrix sp. ST-888]KJK54991.1 glucose-methanol-choline oxidoreductase [Saccharothrix sp. ST-888]
MTATGRGTAGRRWDAIVVGAGFAGSLVAARLGQLGHRVLVLEAGTQAPGADLGHADAVRAYRSAVVKVPNSPYPTTAAAPSPDVTDLVGTADGGYRADGHLVQRGPLPYGSGYLRANGGTGLAWTGLALRMHPEDFRAGDFGHGRNWPIGYAELEPYYRRAERELGVAGDAGEQRTEVGLPLPDGYVFPMHAIPRTHLDQVLADSLDAKRVHDPVAGTDVRLKVVTTPHARNGIPNPAYDDGAGYRPVGAPGAPKAGLRCLGHAACVPICPSQAKYTPLKSQAAWSTSVELVTRAVAGRVLVDGTGRATGVEYRTYGDDGAPPGPARTVEADLVVLAAHAIENARLLLASGLAGGSGQLGRNLMDHPVLLTWGLMPRQVGPYRGPGSTAGLEGFRFGAARARRAPFRIEIGNWGWTWAAGPPAGRVAELLRGGGPDGRGLFGPALRQALGDRVGREFALQFEMEQEADPANRVTIDHRHLDRLGNPRPVLHYDLSDQVKRGMAAARAVSDQIFALLGAEDRTRYGPGPGWPGRFEHQGRSYGFRGAGHGAGTHLMGDSPATSVVDQWQRCWEHPNLYAVGCGSMPSLGTSNPSLTMAALALRSADRIHRDLSALRRAPVTTP